jgi:hypothetical protein
VFKLKLSVMTKSIKGDWSTRTIQTPEGIQVTFFDNKFHNWNGPAIKYPRSFKTKPRYFLYGFEKTRDEWIEARRDRNGVPPDKNPQVKARF